MDGNCIFHMDLLLKLYCLLKRSDINEKVGGVGPYSKEHFIGLKTVNGFIDTIIKTGVVLY